MKFSPTFLEILILLIVCIHIFIWVEYGRKISRWSQAYFHRRRSQRSLKPKSPEDYPLCGRHICFLPHRPKQEVVAWSERKSRRGRPKLLDTAGHACLNPLCDYFAVADPVIHPLDIHRTAVMTHQTPPANRWLTVAALNCFTLIR